MRKLIDEDNIDNGNLRMQSQMIYLIEYADSPQWLDSE